MGWKGKLVFVLMVYFAGFATAIYCLGPTPDSKGVGRAGLTPGAFKSDEFAKSLNSGMHKAIGVGKEAATQAAKLIREKVNETQAKSKG
jgi:hypothetical protein